MILKPSGLRLKRLHVQQTLDPRTTIIGSPETVKKGLERFINETKADELIINTLTFHQEDRMRSYEIVAEMMD